MGNQERARLASPLVRGPGVDQRRRPVFDPRSVSRSSDWSVFAGNSQCSPADCPIRVVPPLPHICRGRRTTGQTEFVTQGETEMRITKSKIAAVAAGTAVVALVGTGAMAY